MGSDMTIVQMALWVKEERSQAVSGTILGAIEGAP